MKRQFPLIITFCVGLFMFVQFFVPHEFSARFYQQALRWMLIIGVFAMALGILSLWTSHYRKVKAGKEGWGFSLATLIGLAGMFTFGLLNMTGVQETLYETVYNYVMVPVMSAMFALLAFFIASAAYRAFRARTVTATVLLLAAVIVMLGRIPLGEFLTFHMGVKLGIPQFCDWILYIPNMASKRAIGLGIGLGSIAMSVKILLGIERSYMGSK